MLTNIKKHFTDILLNNALCHSRINESFENLQIRFLPSHSPFLNPIEECFSVFKSHWKQHLHDIPSANLNKPAAAGTSLNAQRRNSYTPGCKRLCSQVSLRPLCLLTTDMLTLTLELVLISKILCIEFLLTYLCQLHLFSIEI